MLCPECGKGVGDAVTLCSACQLAKLQSKGVGFGQGESVALTHLRPAGFWLRFLASFADAAIVALITLGIDLLLTHVLKVSLSQTIQSFIETSLGQSPIDGIVTALLIASLIAVIGVMIVNSFVWVSYHTLLEASPIGGSLGKAMIGLKVTTENGVPVGVARAFFRNTAKVLSTLPLGIGYLLAGFTKQKQALHDMLTGTVVNASLEMPTNIRTLGCIASVSLFFVWYIFVGNPESFLKRSNNTTQMESYTYSVAGNEADGSVVITNENIGILSKQQGLAGLVHGQTFIPTKVQFSPNVRTLRFKEGDDFFADKEITIFLFTNLEELPGKIFKIGKDTKGSFPHIHISTKTDKQRTPERKVFTKNYALYLRIHGISGKILSGSIKLLVPGSEGAKLAGSFKAQIE